MKIALIKFVMAHLCVTFSELQMGIAAVWLSTIL